MTDRSDEESRPIKRRRRHTETPRPPETPPSKVWTVYLADVGGEVPGRAWWLGRVMGRSEEVAMRAARKRWARFADHPGLTVRPPDRPWPLHLLDRRNAPRSSGPSKGADSS